MAKIFDQEAKDRAVRLVEDRIRVQECSIVSACEQVAPKLGVSASASGCKSLGARIAIVPAKSISWLRTLA